MIGSIEIHGETNSYMREKERDKGTILEIRATQFSNSMQTDSRCVALTERPFTFLAILDTP